jgi:hypothetical protein
MNKTDAEWVRSNTSKVLDYAQKIAKIVETQDNRIGQLEKHIHYPHNETAMKEAAAMAQGQQSAYKAKQSETVPMRSNVEAILTMTAFIKRLLSPEDFAYAVTLEVRNEARRALGFKEREV